MTIREATTGDTRAILLMSSHFLNGTTYGAIIGFESAFLTALLTVVLDQGVIFLAEIDDRVIGMIALVIAISPYTGERYVDEQVWWVEPEYRSGLVGPKLLRAAEYWTKARGLSVLKMVAPEMIAPDDADVGAFYRRLGYVAIETSFIKRF